jgi:hypothetical protein
VSLDTVARIHDRRLPKGREYSIAFISVGLQPGRTTFTFSDFGVAADITAPPPAEVAEEENPAFLAGLGLR